MRWRVSKPGAGSAGLDLGRSVDGMSTISGTRATVSSWGWLDEEGQPCLADLATFRQWSVRTSEGRIGFLALPLDMDWREVLLAAEQIAALV
jgi:hypothetical protein